MNKTNFKCVMRPVSSLNKIAVNLLLCLLLILAQSGAMEAAYGFGQSSDNGGSDTSDRLSFKLRTRFSRQGRDVLTLILSPDDRIVVPVTWDKKTELWDTETGRLIASVDGRPFRPFSYSDLKLVDAFSPDSHTLMTIAGKKANLWDTATGKLKQVLQGHEKDIRSAAFSPDGNTVATGSADGIVKLWDAETGQVKATLDAYKVKKYPRWRIVSRKIANIFADVFVCFSAGGKSFLTVPYDQATKLWDAKNGKLVAVLGEKNFYGTFSPTGRYILTERSDFTGTDLWDAETGKLKATLQSGDATFSPNEQWLGYVGYQGKKGLLNLDTMQIENSMSLNLNDFVTWIGFSPDNKKFVMASGLYGHQAALVDVSTGTVIANMPIVAKQGFDIISDYLKYWEKLSFHPTSGFLMGANQDLVRFWDTQKGEQISVIAEGRDPATFSHTGKFLVTTDKDKKSLSLWEVRAAN